MTHNVELLSQEPHRRPRTCRAAPKWVLLSARSGT